MVREFVGARDYLDEVALQVERLVRRYDRSRVASSDPAEERALAELDLESDRADEAIRARCEASHALGIEIPLERLRRAFDLSPTEVRLVEALVALELAPRVRQAAAAFLDKDGMATVELIEALVHRSERFYRFNLDDHQLSDQNIDSVTAIQADSFVFHGQGQFCAEIDAPQ